MSFVLAVLSSRNDGKEAVATGATAAATAAEGALERDWLQNRRQERERQRGRSNGSQQWLQNITTAPFLE